MKRTVSFILVLISLMSVFTVFASANNMHYVYLPEENDKFIIQPLEGYSVYVRSGEPFEFYIESKEGYSIRAAIISVDDMVNFDTDLLDEFFPEDHPTRRYYKVESVTKDIRIKVTNVNTESNADLFEFLIKMFNAIVEFFQKLFSGGDFDFDFDLGFLAGA